MPNDSVILNTHRCTTFSNTRWLSRSWYECVYYYADIEAQKRKREIERERELACKGPWTQTHLPLHRVNRPSPCLKGLGGSQLNWRPTLKRLLPSTDSTFQMTIFQNSQIFIYILKLNISLPSSYQDFEDRS